MSTVVWQLKGFQALTNSLNRPYFLHEECLRYKEFWLKKLKPTSLVQDLCYKLVQGFSVACLFTGQCNTKGLWHNYRCYIVNCCV